MRLRDLAAPQRPDSRVSWGASRRQGAAGPDPGRQNPRPAPAGRPDRRAGGPGGGAARPAANRHGPESVLMGGAGEAHQLTPDADPDYLVMILLLDLIPPLDLVPMLLLVIAMLLALVLTLVRLVRLLLLPVLVVGGRNWREEACVLRREGGAQRRRR